LKSASPEARLGEELVKARIDGRGDEGRHHARGSGARVTAPRREGRGLVAHLDPAAPEVQHAALEARREAERPRVRRGVDADVAVLGDDGARREAARAEAGGEPGRLRRALEQRGPGPGAGAGRAAAERLAVEPVDRIHDESGAAVAEDIGGRGAAHASVRKRSVARAAQTPRHPTSASTGSRPPAAR